MKWVSEKEMYTSSNVMHMYLVLMKVSYDNLVDSNIVTQLLNK